MSRRPTNRGRGRPATSKDFRIVTVPHSKPNPRDLGRAFLALAIHRAKFRVDSEALEKEASDGSPQ